MSSVLTPIQIEEETRFRAYNDGLTKLPNRYLFSEKLNNAISRAKKTKSNIAIIFLDIDNFKAVNDTLGHVGGDALLKQIAESLKKAVRDKDTVARFGGDEFLIMLDTNTKEDEIIFILNRIMNIFKDPSSVGSYEFLVTASAGVAVYPMDGADADSLIKNADIAMYKAKLSGRNQYMFCTEEIKEEIKTNAELSIELVRALERNELVVYYQPQINLKTQKIMGVEALVRWIHPTKGVISPGVFIPLAERSNLINKIGEWVLKTACIQIKKWQDMNLPSLKVAVNLSAIQLNNTNLLKNIKSIISETGLDPKYIGLEITESTLIIETEDVLNKLVELGVTIAIDDFGIEYSSLSRLRHLQIDQIKIDMEFIQRIETSEKDKAIIMVIINLAKKLGVSVLAEGVETKGQLDFLIKEKCDFVQGYYFYKPKTAEEIEKLLKRK